MQEQKTNISREIEILRKNKNESLKVKNTQIEMRAAFSKFISMSFLNN